MHRLDSPDRVAGDASGAVVTRRGVVERTAALGALVMASGPRAVAAQEEEPRMFTREFRLSAVPSYDGGTVLYLVRRFIASDAPIPEKMYPGVTLYFVAAAAHDGYIELTHADGSTGSTTVHNKNGDNHDIPAGTTIKLYAGDAPDGGSRSRRRLPGPPVPGKDNRTRENVENP